MNQILITEKIYVTPQLKRKRKFFKFEFFLSVFLLCLITSLYIYAEYDKTKSEEVGKMMLSSATELQAMSTNKLQTNQETKQASLSEEEYKVWTFVLEQTDDDEEERITEIYGLALQEETEDENAVETEEENEIKTEKTTALMPRETYYDSQDEPYYVIAILSIPKLDNEFAILSRTTDELLKINPTKFEGYEKGPEPNEPGNFCIVGHNYRDTRFFSQVPSMELGDTIILTDNYNKAVTYELYDKYEVDPTDISCLKQNTDGKREVTLITCTYDGSARVIAKFREQK